MQEIRSSNPPVVTGICDPNKYRARHHRSLELDLKLKYFNKDSLIINYSFQKPLNNKFMMYLWHIQILSSRSIAPDFHENLGKIFNYVLISPALVQGGFNLKFLGKKTPPFQLISTREWPNNHQSMKFEFPLNFDLLKSITFRDSIRYYFWYWLRTWSCNCASWLTMKPPVISQKVLYCLSTLMLGSLNMQWNLFVKATAIKA